MPFPNLTEAVRGLLRSVPTRNGRYERFWPDRPCWTRHRLLYLCLPPDRPSSNMGRIKQHRPRAVAAMRRAAVAGSPQTAGTVSARLRHEGLAATRPVRRPPSVYGRITFDTADVGKHATLRTWNGAGDGRVLADAVLRSASGRCG